MTTLNVQTFTQIVENTASAIQGSCSRLIDFTVGSVLLAIAQANAGCLLWLQGLCLQVLQVTRAATSSASDLDSWMADFSFLRLPASSATGFVTFSRFAANLPAMVPVGAVVQTASGAQQFAVSVDVTNTAYSATVAGYSIAAGVSTVTVPVVAVTPGAAGNLTVGGIALMGTAVPGVDTVTNGAAFAGGLDAEADAAFRVRFVSYVAGLSKATKNAVGTAIAGVQQGLAYTITENYNYAGAYAPGSFYVVVDDGSGAPPSQLLTLIQAAIDAVRPLGSSFAVFGPTKVTANPSMTVAAATGYSHAGVAANVAAALASSIAGLSLGQPLPYTQLAAIAWSVTGVANVTAVQLNGGTADLTATSQQVIRCGTITVS